MSAEAVKNVTLADQIFGQIARRIITGELAPGESLPPERAMAESFGVNRHAVREAVKRAQQAGLVKVVHGGGIRVLDIRSSASVDILQLMVPEQATEISPQIYEYWLAVLELRVAFAAEVARRCAERAPREVGEELMEIVAKMRAARNDEMLLLLDERFWTVAADGCGNIAYRLLLNSIVKIAFSARDLAASWVAREVANADFQAPIAEAILAGDADAAERAARETFQASVDALRAMGGVAGAGA